MANPPPSIAATSTLAMVRTAGARGFPTADLLEEAGLSLEGLEDPDARIPRATVLALWNALRERTSDPVLQLAAPTALPFGAYRIIDHLVAASTTVGEGIRRFARFFGLIADGVSLNVHAGDEEHCLSLAMADGGAVPPVYVDYIFAALVSRIRMRIRPGRQVRRVELRQPSPGVTTLYENLFGSPVRFDAAADLLCFSNHEWDSPTITADASLGGLLEEHARILAHRTPHASSAFAADVQKAIAATMPEGGPASAVARALHVSVRTLHRRLGAGGTTFRRVSDAVRHQLAEQYLADARVSIAEVAFLLGFSDQTSFNRAFRRWTGESPGRWRRRRI